MRGETGRTAYPRRRAVGQWRGWLSMSGSDSTQFPMEPTGGLDARFCEVMDAAPAQEFDLLHEAERQAWHRWFGAQGVSEPGALRGPSFDDPTLLLKAVLAGQGAGLLPLALVADEVDRDHLVKLAGAAWVDDLAYYLVYPTARHDHPKVAAFLRWITLAR